MNQLDAAVAQCDEQDVPANAGNVIPLTSFIRDFKNGLISKMVSTIPPVYQSPNPDRDRVLDTMKRKPFNAQREAVQALSALLLDRNERAAVLNAEMGTGKTAMSIFLAAIMHAAGIRRHLVVSPPHLVYKWRREILDTVPNARVWVLNGPDAIAKLIKLRTLLDAGGYNTDDPEFFILGRVRMRMGFHWKAAVATRTQHVYTEVADEHGRPRKKVLLKKFASCPDCGTIVNDADGNPIPMSVYSVSTQTKCVNEKCRAPLWTLMRPASNVGGVDKQVEKALLQLPTIGPKRASQLLESFGSSFLGSMLEDNIFEFVNLLDADGNFVFTERQAERMGRALSKLEFSMNGGAPYQPTEFIKRYLPRDAFGMLIVDEAHEYKAAGSAQGQAYGVLAGVIQKTLLLTGTLMGGYADDLFYLLYRAMPQRFLEDGFRFNSSRSLGTAAMAFMQNYGVLKQVVRTPAETTTSFKTAKGKSKTHTVSRAPGFSPGGLARYVLPYTVFLKLRDIGQNVLPSYTEEYVEISMSPAMQDAYASMQNKLVAEMRSALRAGDHTLVGVVLNVLLAWPETCFREEVVRHPRHRHLLHYQGSLFDEEEMTPKEEALVDLVRQEVKQGRRVLVYTTYTDKRDTTGRLKSHLVRAGFKTAVLKATVSTDKREDWILDQVDNGCQVLICNPELVKTGLDLLEFPTIIYVNTGYSTFTLQQSSRRSWRIGQKHPVRVFFLGYSKTSQISCLSLMGKKIQVTQSTAGDMPESGLSALNEEGDSLEVALAKELLGTV